MTKFEEKVKLANKEYKTALKIYLKSSAKLSGIYFKEVTKILKEKDFKRALKLAESCPHKLAKIGITNMVNNAKDKHNGWK